MMIPAVIKVFLSDDPNSAVDVPITPNTTAMDVIQYCREPGETACHLAELWRGNEREVSEGEKPYTILQQWGSYAPEVQFYLRHVVGSSGGVVERQNSWADDQNVIQSLANRTDLSLAELKEMAQRQQKQIEQQQQMLVGKEQRLRFLRQQAQQQQAMLGENDRLKRLREKAEAQEAKLKKIRAMRGKLDQRRYDNTTLSAELEAVRALFEDKQSELSKAVTKVDDLTRQLEDLKNSKLGSGGQDGSQQQVNNATVDGNYSSTTELEKLRKELSILNRMNEEQQKQLNEKRGVLKKRNEDAGDLDRRIEDLTDRLKKKRAAAGLPDDQWASGDKYKAQQYKTPPAKMHTIVAAVEPLKQSPQNAQEEYDMMHMKHRQQTYQGYSQDQMNNNNSQGMVQQTGQQYRGQPEGTNRQVPPYLPRQNTYGAPSGNKLPQQKPPLMKSNSSDNLQGQGDGFAANRAVFDNKGPSGPKPPPPGGNRAQSAMAQLFPTPPGKTESLTAKVRPMFAKGSQQQAYGTPNTTSASAASGINLFAYNQPPAVTTPSFLPSNVTVLPSGNIRYTQPPAGHPPPPYPSGSRALYGDPNSPERHVPIDIEALRRKFAHAPRPLKKRSSITEPERPQGPAIPKFIYEQIYKQADTPFYRPSGDETPAVPVPPIPDTPPPAYVAPSKPPLPPLSIPEQIPDAVSYEHNLSPAAYRKQQQNLRKITAAVNQMKTEQEITQSPSPESQDDQSRRRDDYDDHSPHHSNDFETSSDISSSTLPSIVVPQRPYAPVPTKSNLKTKASIPKGLRIRFDPLALLLDASLEGEFDLVQDIIDQVPDPSGANDEGITALHNAVCAGHTDLVRFLVHYGSDINAADTDGWTPLHCAASCNNLSMAKFLVENGACIFATTISDGETATDKCEELDEGYLPCFDYLSGIQEKFGVVNKGQVFALYDYEGDAEDELSYRDGDIMTIIRRGDDNELEWWWARKQDKEGYIARNLLGMWPRIKPRDDRD